ncbi:serine/threonine protein kinase [Ktedonobacter robiniae]|uniref:non-specific serine/threonine protein kinase n=1 Tax=Ktedonobacter robiniae TaxID=2778365 RepID=A0ABQ3V6R1_9CHLR|nr:serine/threonine-protein kinase [Ktedonobacter robiniae]GHO60646.1 hypothetical protein KSB_91210 [Ktedonobacter robiniae]
MPHDSSFIGRQIGNYTLLAKVQSGSFGSVFRAQHTIFDDDPPVALKLLHMHLTSPQEREGFLQEAKLLRKLRHPFILPIIDAGIYEGQPYLSTEFATGGSLSERIRAQAERPFPLHESLQWISQMGQGLAYAHQHAVMHRDLKPANILFNSRGEALLADFGIAVVLETSSTRNIGELSGTPAYMAPEQYQGYVGPRSDQYALACIAYELLTGHRLFDLEAPSIAAFQYHHINVQPTAPHVYNAALPPECEFALLKALAKTRDQRYPDVATFLEALCSPLQDLPTVVPGGQQAHPSTQVSQMSARDYKQQGFEHFKNARYEEALEAYEEAIRLDPNFAEAYFAKGAC